ncbi:CatB-related O-acetyltransferase [Chitinophaga deserti]|uniref:CatB-related O-acetyltransferase n=1 Tax=Chitinophaga deserti TaxID=2164099 RepID=UPI000D6A967F
MSIVKLFYTWIEDLRTYLSRSRHLAAIRTAFPDSRFYSGVQAPGSSFGRHVVIFKNSVVSNCSVGAHTYIQKESVVLNADIGNFCSIAAGVVIGPGMHPVDGVTTHPAFYLKNTPLVRTFAGHDKVETSLRVRIGHDVWIGQHAMIMDGVTIGTGAVIAAGAIVTKDVAPYTIVGGLPARKLKDRFEEHIAEALLNSRWWEMDDNWLAAHADDFVNPSQLLAKINNAGPSPSAVKHTH